MSKSIDETALARIGDRIVELRSRRGWTQRELARRAGLGQPRLSNLEKGARRSPNLSELARLAAAFEIGLDELAFGGRRSAGRRTHDRLRELEGLATPEEMAGLGRLLELLLLGVRAALGPPEAARFNDA